MAWVRISVDEACKDGYTCPSVWMDAGLPEQVVVVGVPCTTVPGVDGAAVRVRRQVLEDAGLRVVCGEGPDHAVVMGVPASPGTVPVGAGEVAIVARELVRF